MREWIERLTERKRTVKKILVVPIFSKYAGAKSLCSHELAIAKIGSMIEMEKERKRKREREKERKREREKERKREREKERKREREN